MGLFGRIEYMHLHFTHQHPTKVLSNFSTLRLTELNFNQSELKHRYYGQGKRQPLRGGGDFGQKNSGKENPLLGQMGRLWPVSKLTALYLNRYYFNSDF